MKIAKLIIDRILKVPPRISRMELAAMTLVGSSILLLIAGIGFYEITDWGFVINSPVHNAEFVAGSFGIVFISEFVFIQWPLLRMLVTLAILIALCLTKLEELDADSEIQRYLAIGLFGFLFAGQLLSERAALGRITRKRFAACVAITIPLLATLVAGIVRVQFGLTQLQVPRGMSPQIWRPRSFAAYDGPWLSHEDHGNLLLTITNNMDKIIHLTDSASKVLSIRLLDPPQDGSIDTDFFRFSPDKHWLAVVLDHRACVYRVENTEGDTNALTLIPFHAFDPLPNGISCVEFLQDNNTLVSCGGDWIVSYDVAGHKESGRIQLGHFRNEDQATSFYHIASSPTDRLIAVAYECGLDIFSLPDLRHIRGVSLPAIGLITAFSRDGQSVITPVAGMRPYDYVTSIHPLYWPALVGILGFAMISILIMGIAPGRYKNSRPTRFAQRGGL